jgi:hypothetical protein
MRFTPSSGIPNVAEISDTSRPSLTSRVKVSQRVTSSIQPRDILDQRGLDGVGVVAVGKDRARHRVYVDTVRPPFFRDDAGGAEATRARDDLIGVGRAIRTHQHRHDNAALAHRRQYIGHVGGLLGIAHIGLADRQLAKLDKLEFHGHHLAEGAGPSLLAGLADRLTSGGKRPPASSVC